jgi:uncharacterized glyoxalase superfamily protein PhnB
MNLPEHYSHVMPYLIVPDVAALETFLRTVLHAEPHFRMNAEDGALVHAEDLVGTSLVMYSPSMDQYPASTAGMFICIEDVDEAFERAKGLGAEVIMELSDQPYGRTCGVRDTNGNTWWLTRVEMSAEQ